MASLLYTLIPLAIHAQHVGNSDHADNADNADNTDNSQHSQTHAIPTISLMIFFIFASLTFAGILKEITKRLKFLVSIPFTPILFLIGIGIGVFRQHLGHLGMAVNKVIEISPEGLLMIFLPVLIFESAFNADWHIFRRQISQILILSFPCVVCGSVLIMISIKEIIGYGEDYYTWPGAFMFGSIISCTDAVAVIALLKDIGTPKKFNSLIEGESLLNDGTSMVLLIVSSQIVKGKPSSIMGTIWLFFSLTIGGLLLGLIFGVLSTFWIKRIFNDGIQAVSITMISCYMVFYIAEDVDLGFHVSGIIALASLGLYMAAFGKTSFNVEVEEYVEGFWKYAVFCAQTIMFILSGILVGTKVFAVAESNIVIDDFYKLLVLYLCIIVARFLSISLFMGVLPNLGYGLTWREVYVLTYGGVRGAIGISFSLIVYNDTQFNDKLRDIILFDMAGNVILSLLVNGTTAGFFIKMVGMGASSKVKQKMYIEFIRYLEYECESHKLEIADQSPLPSGVFEKLENKTGQKQLKILAASLEENLPVRVSNSGRNNTGLELAITDHYRRQNGQQDGPIRSQLEQEKQFSNEELEIIAEVRSRFLMTTKKQYWEFNESNNTSAEASIILIEAANFDLDKQNEEMNSFEWIKDNIPKKTIRFLHQHKEDNIFGNFASNYLFHQISYSYDVISSFIEAQEKVRSQVEKFVFDSFEKKYVEPIFKESRQMEKEAIDFLHEELLTKYPEICKEVQTRKATFHILEHAKDILNRNLQIGQIDHTEYSLLKDKLDKRSTKLQMETPQWKNLSFKECLEQNDIFKDLPNDVIRALQNDSTSTTFVEGDVLVRENSSAKYLYFIRRGILTCYYKAINGPVETKLTLSNIAGLSAVVSKTYRATIVATTPTDVSIIKIKYFLKVMDSFPKFEEAFWKKYCHLIIRIFAASEQHSLSHVARLDKRVLSELVKTTEFRYLNPGKHVLDHNAILVRGSMKEEEDCIQLLKKDVPIDNDRRISILVDVNDRFL